MNGFTQRFDWNRVQIGRSASSFSNSIDPHRRPIGKQVDTGSPDTIKGFWYPSEREIVYIALEATAEQMVYSVLTSNDLEGPGRFGHVSGLAWAFSGRQPACLLKYIWPRV